MPRVAAVGVGVEAAAHQGVRGHLPLADEGVTLEHLDACRPAHDGGEQGRVLGVGGPGEGRVQGEEARRGRVERVLLRNQDISVNSNIQVQVFFTKVLFTKASVRVKAG